MSYRVILRLSLNNDVGSRIRNTIHGDLSAVGMRQTKTGTWESSSLTEEDAAYHMAKVLLTIAHVHNPNKPTVPNAHPDSHLDHLWIYIDSN